MTTWILSAILILVTTQAFAFDLAAIKSQYHTDVGIPYKNAVTVLATDIVEYLATTPVPTTAESAEGIVGHLTQKTRIFSSTLGQVVGASDGLRVTLDRESERLVSEGSNVEQQISRTNQQLQQINAQIQQTNAQLSAAQAQVDQAVQSVQHAERVLKEEEDRIEKARHCRGKRFIKKIKNAIRKVTKPIEKAVKDVIVKPVCSVVNMGGIDSAKAARGRAQEDLNQQRNRLAQLQGQLAQLTAAQGQLHQQKANQESIKANLNSQLAQTNQARNNVLEVNAGLKGVIAHIGTLWGKSQVLATVIKNLIDMETVIKPLTAIAHQVASYSGNQVDMEQLNVMKQKINANLPVIREKLAQYALIPPVDPVMTGTSVLI